MSNRSPDACAISFLGFAPDATRYATEDQSPLESNDTITNLVRPGATVLDIGCGIGAISARLVRDRCAKVVGVEPDPTRAEAARFRGLNVFQTYIDEHNVSSFGAYDFVLLADVLEHMQDPGGLLELVKQLLLPDGAVIISVPNVAHWSVRCNLLFGRFKYEQYGIMDATHLRWFTRSSLEQFLGNCGYSIRGIQYTAGATLPVYERMKWLPRSLRARIARSMSQRLPSIFACQFVVVASPVYKKFIEPPCEN